jgi:hypothetical protein
MDEWEPRAKLFSNVNTISIKILYTVHSNLGTEDETFTQRIRVKLIITQYMSEYAHVNSDGNHIRFDGYAIRTFYKMQFSE